MAFSEKMLSHDLLSFTVLPQLVPRVFSATEGGRGKKPWERGCLVPTIKLKISFFFFVVPYISYTGNGNRLLKYHDNKV